MSNDANLLRMLEPSVRPMGAPTPVRTPGKPLDKQSFAEVLDGISGKPAGTYSQPLNFSAHATQRLQQQGIELSSQQQLALADAADRAEAKGATDALMIMDKLGLVVNVPKRTVVTALTEDRMRDGIVTQIDSAVMVDATKATNDTLKQDRIHL